MHTDNIPRLEVRLAHMQAAFAYASCSHARRLKTGALIVKNDRPVSSGFNGTPYGLDNTCEDPPLNGQVNLGQDEVSKLKESGYDPAFASYITRPNVIHAEMNAILALAGSNESARGATLYATDQPCQGCAAAIIQSRVGRVIYRRPYRLLTGLIDMDDAGVAVYSMSENGQLFVRSQAAVDEIKHNNIHHQICRPESGYGSAVK